VGVVHHGVSTTAGKMVFPYLLRTLCQVSAVDCSAETEKVGMNVVLFVAKKLGKKLAGKSV